MPYNSNSEVPGYVPREHRKKWRDIWNAAYEQSLKDGKSAEESEKYAFAVANAKAGPNADKALPIRPITSEEEMAMDPVAKGANLGQKEIFCPLVKVDAVKREVWGVVTGETPDRDNEICDYDSTIPYYKEVVSDMSKATDGENIFPLRAMHGLIAAGKGIFIEFRDADKEVYMGFKVVDDQEWKKVEERVYTGFSQGGRYIKKWQDGDYVRYTAKPGEVSLVDVPCLSRATYEYIKADGTKELRKFSGAEEHGAKQTMVKNESEADGKCSCKCASCGEGKCAGCTADQKCEECAKQNAEKAAAEANQSDKTVKYLVTDKDGKGQLPYTKADGTNDYRLMKKAWTALHGKYEGSDKQKAIKSLKQVYAKAGIDTPAEKSSKFQPILLDILKSVIESHAYGQLNKGMYTISRFAELSSAIEDLWLTLEYERDREQDDSPVTDDMKALYHNLLDALLDYAEEQVDEAKQESMERAFKTYIAR